MEGRLDSGGDSIVISQTAEISKGEECCEDEPTGQNTPV
jgi:hypothetical protein